MEYGLFEQRARVHHDADSRILSNSDQKKLIGATYRKLFKINDNNERSIHISDVVATVLANISCEITLPGQFIDSFMRQIVATELKKGQLNKKSWLCSLTCLVEIVRARRDESLRADQLEHCNVGVDVDATPPTTFAELIASQDSHCIETPPSPSRFAEAFGLSIPIFHEIIPRDQYTMFKESFLTDLQFVPEFKANARITLQTKRLYAVYGNAGTGMSYNCFYRNSVDKTPECIRTLFSALLPLDYRVKSSTCVMFTVYPPSSAEDIVSARENNRQTFCAMGSHADDDSYLGDVNNVEVFTVSGFIDLEDTAACPSPSGWRFIVHERRIKNRESDIGLGDNMLLLQPRGMQSFLQHRVEGIMSPYIRWVATLRNVDTEAYERVKLDLEGNVLVGQNLREWAKGDSLVSWQQTLRPSTNTIERNRKKRQKTAKPMPSLLDLLYRHGIDLMPARSLLLSDKILYCASCHQLLLQQLHACPASKSCIFGKRNLQVGQCYTAVELVLAKFTGGSSIDSSFNGLAGIGCTSMILRKKYDGNEWLEWQNGVVHVGGAKESASDAQINFRNDMVLTSGRHKLPIEVAVEHEDKFMYIGSWYVMQTKINSWTSDGVHPCISFKLISKSVFLSQGDVLDRKRHLNPTLEALCTRIASQRAIDEEADLTSDGQKTLKQLFGFAVELDRAIEFLQSHCKELCTILELPTDVSFTHSNIVCAMNSLAQ